MAEEIERLYVIPLKKKGFKSSKAAPTAVKRVKAYLTKHMKVEEKDIWIDDSLNNALWAHGRYKMPSKIRIKAVKFEDGVVEAYLPELSFKKSRRELIKEERESKAPILKREEVEEGEGAETGAEDYDIAPTADGDVKIKKKKAAKEKTDKEEKAKDKKETKDKPKKDEKKETKKTVPKKSEKKDDKKPVKPKKETEKKTEPKKSTDKKETKKSSPKKEGKKPEEKSETKSNKKSASEEKKKSE